MEEGRASQFDSRVLDAFFSRVEAVTGVQLEYAEDD